MAGRERRRYTGLFRFRAVRILALLLVNAALLIAVFAVAEIGYRIHRNGCAGAFASFLDDVPYSNLGTSNWVIYDEDIGFRLNPAREKFNAFSVRHGEIAVPKPDGVYRVLFLGDSVTWAKDGFVARVRESLGGRGRIEVINAGVPGYTSYQEVLFYKKYLAPVAPDLVVWVYCLNDNHKFLHRFDEKAKMLWTAEAEETLKIRSFGDRVVSRSYLLTRLRVALAAKDEADRKRSHRFFWEGRVDFNIAWKDESWPFHEEQLLELRRVLLGQNAKLAVVAVPYEPQFLYRSRTKDFDYVVKPQRKLKELCERYRVPYADLFSAFAAEYDAERSLYKDGVHLNEQGHRLAGREMLGFLSEHDLIPASE